MAYKNKEDEKRKQKECYERNKEVYKARSKKCNAITKKRNKEFVAAYKLERGCSVCGYIKYARVLELHHVDPNGKDGNISNMVKQSYSIEKIKEELDKCVVMCANCHREFHVELDEVQVLPVSQ